VIASVAKRRVIITGCGVISALGAGAPRFAQALAAGRSGIGLLDRLAAVERGRGSGRYPVGARIDNHAASVLAGYQHALLDPVSQYALAAGEEACEQSGLLAAQALCEGVGVFVGTGMGGAMSVERAYADLFGLGTAPRPLSILCAMNNAPASHLSMRFGLKGPNLSISTACASSTIAIGEAFRAIRCGRLTCALAGGTEACLVGGVMRAWESLRVLADARADNAAASCRPFALTRDGIVLGEGAAMFVLESLESAVQRGAPVLAELLGYGAAADASHIANPNVDGQARAMQAALDDAGLTPEEIDYVNAHGTATRVGDLCETLALKRVFGTYASRLPISSTKSAHGHLLGAAGAIELAACLAAMSGEFLPATLNLDAADPDCDLDYVPNVPRHGVAVRRFMSNSFAFGGSNAVLIGGLV
jgi:3-oxoacyl-[acyl-carrier-protein] synthase II